MATVVVLPSTTLTQFNLVNGSSSTTGNKVTLFTASSAANVLTTISGRFGASTASIQFCIVPTAGVNPTSTNGSLFWDADGFQVFYGSAQITGTTGSVAGATITPGATLAVSAANYIVELKDFVVPPGYSVAVYQTVASAVVYGYAITQMEIDYNV